MKKTALLFLIAVLVSLPRFTFSSGEFNDKFKIKTVVIDAGHGGKDTGAIGYSKIKEKNIALSVALKLGSYIEENYPEVKVIYTRKTDVFIELHERAAIANRANADLFISIHCNAIGTNTVDGTEVFVLGLHKSEANLNVAKRENSVILMEENHEQQYKGFDPNAPESHIMLTIFTDAHLDQSISFAAALDNQFVQRVQRKSRGIKQAGFVVLALTAMPSVLIELGFITNQKEEAFLASEDGQVYMASAIYRAFKEYKTAFETALPPPTIANDEPPKPTIEYKVQFMAATKELDKNDRRLKGIEQVEIEKAGSNIYRYLSGSFSDYDYAVRHQEQIRKMGHKDAFIVAYRDGERLSADDAVHQHP